MEWSLSSREDAATQATLAIHDALRREVSIAEIADILADAQCAHMSYASEVGINDRRALGLSNAIRLGLFYLCERT